MPGFLKRVQNVIQQSDIVLEIVDARFPQQTRNLSLEQSIISKGKKLIIVLNKTDLISKNSAKKIKQDLSREHPVVFISAVKRQGQSILRNEILRYVKKSEITVGVIGYPNTGKSSLVNMLRGKKVAKTSLKAGFTQGEQWIKLGKNIKLVDTPGIIPFEEREESMLVLIGAKSSEQVKDPVSAAEIIIMHLLEHNKSGLEKNFGIEITDADDPEKVLEKIAVSRKRLLKGGIADILGVAKQLIRDWHKGKLRI